MIYVEHPPIQEKNNYVQEEKVEIKRIPNVHRNEEQENVDNNTSPFQNKHTSHHSQSILSTRIFTTKILAIASS